MSEAREYISRTGEQGDIYISEDVLAMIAGAAAMEIEGVSGLAGTNLSEQFLGKKSLTRGVAIQREGEELIVSIAVTLQYGCHVMEVARRIQEAITSSVAATSGLTVQAVNVRVAGITFEKQGKN